MSVLTPLHFRFALTEILELALPLDVKRLNIIRLIGNVQHASNIEHAGDLKQNDVKPLLEVVDEFVNCFDNAGDGSKLKEFLGLVGEEESDLVRGVSVIFCSTIASILARANPNDAKPVIEKFKRWLSDFVTDVNVTGQLQLFQYLLKEGRMPNQMMRQRLRVNQLMDFVQYVIEVEKVDETWDNPVLKYLATRMDEVFSLRQESHLFYMMYKIYELNLGKLSLKLKKVPLARTFLYLLNFHTVMCTSIRGLELFVKRGLTPMIDQGDSVSVLSTLYCEDSALAPHLEHFMLASALWGVTRYRILRRNPMTMEEIETLMFDLIDARSDEDLTVELFKEIIQVSGVLNPDSHAYKEFNECMVGTMMEFSAKYGLGAFKPENKDYQTQLDVRDLMVKLGKFVFTFKNYGNPFFKVLYIKKNLVRVDGDPVFVENAKKKSAELDRMYETQLCNEAESRANLFLEDRKETLRELIQFFGEGPIVFGHDSSSITKLVDASNSVRLDGMNQNYFNGFANKDAEELEIVTVFGISEFFKRRPLKSNGGVEDGYHVGEVKYRFGYTWSAHKGKKVVYALEEVEPEPEPEPEVKKEKEIVDLLSSDSEDSSEDELEVVAPKAMVPKKAPETKVPEAKAPEVKKKKTLRRRVSSSSEEEEEAEMDEGEAKDKVSDEEEEFGAPTKKGDKLDNIINEPEVTSSKKKETTVDSDEEEEFDADAMKAQREAMVKNGNVDTRKVRAQVVAEKNPDEVFADREYLDILGADTEDNLENEDNSFGDLDTFKEMMLPSIHDKNKRESFMEEKQRRIPLLQKLAKAAAAKFAKEVSDAGKIRTKVANKTALDAGDWEYINAKKENLIKYIEKLKQKFKDSGSYHAQEMKEKAEGDLRRLERKELPAVSKLMTDYTRDVESQASAVKKDFATMETRYFRFISVKHSALQLMAKLKPSQELTVSPDEPNPNIEALKDVLGKLKLAFKNMMISYSKVSDDGALWTFEENEYNSTYPRAFTPFEREYIQIHVKSLAAMKSDTELSKFELFKAFTRELFKPVKGKVDPDILAFKDSILDFKQARGFSVDDVEEDYIEYGSKKEVLETMFNILGIFKGEHRDKKVELYKNAIHKWVNNPKNGTIAPNTNDIMFLLRNMDKKGENKQHIDEIEQEMDDFLNMESDDEEEGEGGEKHSKAFYEKRAAEAAEFRFNRMTPRQKQVSYNDDELAVTNQIGVVKSQRYNENPREKMWLTRNELKWLLDKKE